MAGSINKVILIGNLGKDPEIRRTQDGRPIANLSIATSETWRDKQSGERREKTEWHRVVVFDEHIAKFAEQYLKKGAKVYLEGQIQTRKWTDQAGVEKYSTEIVVQAFRGVLQSLQAVERSDGRQGEDQLPTQQTNAYAAGHGKPVDGPGRAQRRSGFAENKNFDMDDDIPF